MLELLGWATGLGAAVYFFYSYNLLVRKHIEENKLKTQAKKFNWIESAKRYLSIYRSL